MERLLTCILMVTTSIVQCSAITDYGACRSPLNEISKCVSLEDCTNLYQLYQLSRNNSLTPFQVEYLKQSQCGLKNGQVLICCPSYFIEHVEIKNRAETETMFCPQDLAAKRALLPQSNACGRGLAVRIVGGNEAEIDEYPWMVLIEYTKPGFVKGFHCGGSLINDRYVLTAAHCIVNYRGDWSLSGVRLGEWDTRTNPDCIELSNDKNCVAPYIDISISIQDTIVHPKYTTNYQNDIALIRLSTPVKFSRTIEPICLPVDDVLRNKQYQTEILEVAGWGHKEEGVASNIKLKAELRAYDQSDCRRKYASYNFEVTQNQICAGGQFGVDSCKGDSGGPLMALEVRNRTEGYYLIGIISVGPEKCGRPQWPAIHTRVGVYMNWILSNIHS